MFYAELYRDLEGNDNDLMCKTPSYNQINYVEEWSQNQEGWDYGFVYIKTYESGELIEKRISTFYPNWN